MELISKKAALSEKTKEEVSKICKSALPDENGDPRLCNDNDVLTKLKKSLMGLRKIA